MPVCLHCGTIDANHYKLNIKGEFKGMYKCRACKERFTVTLGNMFEGSPNIIMQMVYCYLHFSAHKKAISSHQLARDLDFTQKTAWFMLHRLRLAFNDNNGSPLGGEGVIVETDTTIVGGKVKNMSNSKRREFKVYPWHKVTDNKTTVTAYVERGGQLRFDVKDAGETEKELLAKHVDKGSFLMTGDKHIYNKIAEQFYSGHEKVNHSKDEYVGDGTV